jgi:hypothetical protein
LGEGRDLVLGDTDDLVTGAVEKQGHGFSDDRFVLNNQNLGHSELPSLAGSFRPYCTAMRQHRE